jgi:predicted DNA-binding ribbon-helix-helix protein
MDQLKHIKKSVVIKRSIFINGHKTSVSLENEFWHGLREIAEDSHVCWWNRSTAAATTAIYRRQFAYSFSTVCGAGNSA